MSALKFSCHSLKNRLANPKHAWTLSTLGTSNSNSSSSSVNPAEIAHFSRLSSLWWDERGEFGLLHKMNPIRMQFIREKLTEVAREENETETETEDADVEKNAVMQGLDVLDVGCGGGLLSEVRARWVSTPRHRTSPSRLSTLPADPSLSLPAPAGPSLTYLHTTTEALLEEEEDRRRRFDVVCAMEVIEHVDNPAAFLASCAELVKPGGHLFLSTIARTPLSYALTILAAEHILHKVEPGTHTHSKYINPSELIAFFQKHHRRHHPLSSAGGGGERGRGRPWIGQTHEHGLPTRREAEVRGMVYVPWSGRWVLMPRGATAWGAAQCNYLFWVRKPLE